MTAAARILPSSVRAPLPLGVLITSATWPFFIRSIRFGRPSCSLGISSTAMPACAQRLGRAARGQSGGSPSPPATAPIGTTSALSRSATRDEHRARQRQRRCWPPAGSWRTPSGKSSSMPITSPVERISGPRMMSTPGNLLNGNTLSLTEKCFGTTSSMHAQFVQRLADHHQRGETGQRHIRRLGDERHGPAGAGIDLQDVDRRRGPVGPRSRRTARSSGP